MACDSLITPNSKSASTCFRISFCFSSECLRGGTRLHGSRHLSSSITIFIGSTDAGSRRTFVANASMNSRTNVLSLAWSCVDPSKVIWHINWSGVSSEPSVESTSKGLYFQLMSSSSSIGSKISFFLVSSSSFCVERWPYAEECGDVLPQSTRYCHDLWL